VIWTSGAPNDFSRSLRPAYSPARCPDEQKTHKNCKKPYLSKGKSAETAPVFVQNKPKVKSPQIYLTAVITSTYAQMDNWLNAKNKPNQTQFNPKTNPTPKMLINPYIRALYTQKPPSRGPKNKPNSKPMLKMNTNPYKIKTYSEKPPSGPIKTNPNKPNNQSSLIADHLERKTNSDFFFASSQRKKDSNYTRISL
jgi:hypothetical protein